MAEKKVLTLAGKAKLEQELAILNSRFRNDISEKIKEARSFGDLSENAEYEAAKKEQAEVAAKIEEIEEILKTAVIVSDDTSAADVVSIGKIVKVEYYGALAEELEINGEDEFLIVGASEADAVENKLSYASPICKACMDKRAGDEVVAEVPAGMLNIRILDVKVS